MDKKPSAIVLAKRELIKNAFILAKDLSHAMQFVNESDEIYAVEKNFINACNSLLVLLEQRKKHPPFKNKK